MSISILYNNQCRYISIISSVIPVDALRQQILSKFYLQYLRTGLPALYGEVRTISVCYYYPEGAGHNRRLKGLLCLLEGELLCNKRLAVYYAAGKQTVSGKKSCTSGLMEPVSMGSLPCSIWGLTGAGASGCMELYCIMRPALPVMAIA